MKKLSTQLSCHPLYGVKVSELSDLLHQIPEDLDSWKQNNSYPEFVCTDNPDQVNFVEESIDLEGELKGMSVNGLETMGEALVLHSPQEALKIKDLSNKILITQTTDPAWVFLMGQCRGLISEKEVYSVIPLLLGVN